MSARLRLLDSTPYYEARVDDDRHILVYVRSETSFPNAAMFRTDSERFLTFLPTPPAFATIIDLRKVRGRSADDHDVVARWFTSELKARSLRTVFLVATQIGVLQTQRLVGQESASFLLTRDEAEAFVFAAGTNAVRQKP